MLNDDACCGPFVPYETHGGPYGTHDVLQKTGTKALWYSLKKKETRRRKRTKNRKRRVPKVLKVLKVPKVH